MTRIYRRFSFRAIEDILPPMRIVSLAPYVSENLVSLGLRDALVGVSHRCRYPKELGELPPVTRESSARGGGAATLAELCAPATVDLGAVAALKPTHIIGSIPEGSGVDQRAVEAQLRAVAGLEAVKYLSFAPLRLADIYQMFEELGVVLQRAERGRDCAQRLKAQLMDWCANFNERTRNKRVTVLSSFSPLRTPSQWIPEIISLASSQSQAVAGEALDRDVTWEAIRDFAPHVLLLAERHSRIEASMKLLPRLEALPGWEALPAVKRGDFIFAEGETLYTPTMRLIDGAAIVISAIGGMESGYIAPRDSFQRLRWVELQRHRISS